MVLSFQKVLIPREVLHRYVWGRGRSQWLHICAESLTDDDYAALVCELRDVFSAATFGALESEQAYDYSLVDGEIFAAHDGSGILTEQDLAGYA